MESLSEERDSARQEVHATKVAHLQEMQEVVADLRVNVSRRKQLEKGCKKLEAALQDAIRSLLSGLGDSLSSAHVEVLSELSSAPSDAEGGEEQAKLARQLRAVPATQQLLQILVPVALDLQQQRDRYFAQQGLVYQFLVSVSVWANECVFVCALFSVGRSVGRPVGVPAPLLAIVLGVGVCVYLLRCHLFSCLWLSLAFPLTMAHRGAVWTPVYLERAFHSCGWQAARVSQGCC